MLFNMGFEAFSVGTGQLLMRVSTPPLSAPLQKSLLPWPCPGDCLFSPESSFVLLAPPRPPGLCSVKLVSSAYLPFRFHSQFCLVS